MESVRDVLYEVHEVLGKSLNDEFGTWSTEGNAKVRSTVYGVWKVLGHVIEKGRHRRFKLGDRVTKTRGSCWTGKVVGFYSTLHTPVGYCVESENEVGSVQIYPEAYLEKYSEGPLVEPKSQADSDYDMDRYSQR